MSSSFQRVFRAANDRGMAIVMGIPPAGANGESYSVAQARVFPERLLPDALLSVCVSRRKCHKPFELHCKEKCTRYCARTPTAFPVLSERSVRSAQHLEGDVPALVSHLLTAQDISPGDRDRIRAVLDATATPSEGAD